jgi:acyl-[acyl-carrier-protein] desaturase
MGVTMPRDGRDEGLLRELELTAENLLNRHLALSKEWMPHEFIPWSLGREFDLEPWTPEQVRLSDIARTAFEMSLLTEDNLPSYHRQQFEALGRDGVWAAWSHRWTAEEARHSDVIRTYLLVSRNTDPTALEQSRMATMQLGSMLPDKPALHTIAYSALQELATRITYGNTGRYARDPVADRIMNRLAIDENLHMVFYRDVLKAALEIDPSSTIEAVTDEVIGFKMPGIGIQGYTHKALQLAQAGIFNLRIHHDQVLQPLLRHWKVFWLGGLSAGAEHARERLVTHLARVNRLAARYEMRVAETSSR